LVDFHFKGNYQACQQKWLSVHGLRQVINKLVRGAEMKKEEALKAVESLKTTPDERNVMGNRTERDYAALSGVNFRKPVTKK
jgi:hypothetical protein